MWERFKLRVLKNEHQKVKDFEETSDSAFEISYDRWMCRCETEEGESELCKKQKNSENYFQVETTRDKVEWKSVLGKKWKKGVMKVLGTIGAKSEIETEYSETPFDDKIQ